MIPQERIDAVRAQYRLSDVVRRRTKLRRAGRELVGLCVFHKERTGSLGVNDAKGVYNCFGCGAHGDIIAFVQATERVSFAEAIDRIDGGALAEVDPAERARAIEEDAAERAAAIAEAAAFWEDAVDVPGTPADRYLRGRGIDIRPPALRFGYVPAGKNRVGEWGPRLPALILRADDAAGDLVAIQRIFLTEAGAKSPMAKPKLSLGRIKGATIRIGRPTSDVIATGGPEDGLTLAQRFPGVPVHISCGEGLLPFLRFPPRFTRWVTIAGQNDRAGRLAVAASREAYRRAGLLTRDLFPDRRYKDWNDELRRIARETPDG